MFWLYDNNNKMFVEDSSIRISRNWGVLLEEEEYTFSFIRLDIVGNTKLVKKYPNFYKNTYHHEHRECSLLNFF